MTPEQIEERKQWLRQAIAEKEQRRQDAKGLKERLDKNLYRSPLVDDTEDDTDSIFENCFYRDPIDHKYTLIWLHGIMEDNTKAQTMLEMISPEDVRVVIPNAPKIPLTALDESEERAWWDIEHDTSQGNYDDEEDTAGIRESYREIVKLVEIEEAKIGSNNIILAGFGQGGALALHTALRYPAPLCGVMTWAAYLVDMESYPDEISPQNSTTKILAYHGKNDDVVLPKLAFQGLSDLKSFGLPLEVRLVPRMGHYVDQAQWVQGFDWCMRRFREGRS